MEKYMALDGTKIHDLEKEAARDLQKGTEWNHEEPVSWHVAIAVLTQFCRRLFRIKVALSVILTKIFIVFLSPSEYLL
jgi:hypothetical protein